MVDAGLDGAVGHEVVDADGLRLLDHTGDLDGPRPGVKRFGVDLGLALVGAELVEVVVAGGLGLGGLGIGDGVGAGDGLEGGGGLNGAGVEEAGEIAGETEAGGGGGGSGEEAAAGLARALEGGFRGDLGGFRIGAQLAGGVDVHGVASFPGVDRLRTPSSSAAACV